MARKSKGNFNLKGHSIPGIKGFKGTSLEDGRAASSAFQMEKSPLHETELESGNLDFAKEELGKQDKDYMPRTQLAGQSGVNYALAQAQRLAQARKEGKDKKDVITEQIDKYEGGEGTYEEYLADVGEGEGTLSMAEWSELNSQNTEPDEILGDADDMSTTYNPPKEEETNIKEEIVPYEVQSGDNLSKIARANNMTLEELLEKNPEYKDNPNFVRSGATINL